MYNIKKGSWSKIFLFGYKEMAFRVIKVILIIVIINLSLSLSLLLPKTSKDVISTSSKSSIAILSSLLIPSISNAVEG